MTDGIPFMLWRTAKLRTHTVMTMMVRPLKNYRFPPALKKTMVRRRTLKQDFIHIRRRNSVLRIPAFRSP